jgi:hypothetical protein
MEETLQTPLNKAQLELLRLFSRVKSEEELLDIKRMVTQYYAERVKKEVNKAWEERGYTQEDLDRMANSPS